MGKERDRPAEGGGNGRAATVAALQALLDNLGEPVIVRVLSVRSHRRLAQLRIDPPPSRPQLAEPEVERRDDDERDCHADILAVLQAAGRRLTTDQILHDLEANGWHHGERTVKAYLGAMVRSGCLSNERKSQHPGYFPQSAK